jgi:hypothetical protein
MNIIYLTKYGVQVIVTGISMYAGKNTELVIVSADLDRFFPGAVPELIVTESGFAEIQIFSRNPLPNVMWLDPRFTKENGINIMPS